MVFPRLVAADHPAQILHETISSGIKELDLLLGGGLDRGTSTLIVGPAGTGKSILMYQHAVAAAERGENSLIFVFDENINTITRRTEKLGLPLQKWIDAGRIHLRSIDPAELPPGELSHHISTTIRSRPVSLVCIDSLNGYIHAMPDERFLILQLHELLTHLSLQGIVSILTMAQHGMVGTMKSPIDLTYLSDTVILLRFFEAGGKIRKAISVIKKRSGSHEDSIRELKMDSTGVHVGDPLVEFHGILTGIPTFVGDDRQML